MNSIFYMYLLPHCFCLNLLVGRERLILLCLNETVCYIRFSHLARTANTTIMHNELLFVSPKLTQTLNVPPQTLQQHSWQTHRVKLLS